MPAQIYKSNYFKTLIYLFPVFFFYFWDLGNLDGPRQGTESFYLAISREMYELKSFLTPMFQGATHWSKPPLHFWLPFPLYYLNAIPSLAMARLSMALVGILGTWAIARWSKKHFHISAMFTFLFLCSSIGFIKYSRIFMIEMPMTILTCLGSLYFYQYSKDNKLSSLLLSSIILGLATLTKGPVSLVMSFGSCFIYTAFLYFVHKQNIIKKLIIWALLSTLFGSIWFLISYAEHGHEFFYTFFIRENIGKFQAKSYPYSVLFQGLLIYSLPWGLYTPILIYQIKDSFKDYFKSITHLPLVFILINFFVFFVLWFTPQQKSHHYAMPAMPFFLLAILRTTFSLNLNIRRTSLYKFTNFLVLLLMSFLLLVLLTALRLQDVFSDPLLLYKIDISIITILIACFLYIRNSSNTARFLSSLYVFGVFWVIIVPSFALPLTPHAVIKLAKGKKVAVVKKRPYFVEEALQQKVHASSEGNISTYISTHPKSLTIISTEILKRLKIDKFSKTLHTWSVWRKRLAFKDVVSALWKGEIDHLREEYSLVQLKE